MSTSPLAPLHARFQSLRQTSMALAAKKADIRRKLHAFCHSPQVIFARALADDMLDAGFTSAELHWIAAVALSTAEGLQPRYGASIPAVFNEPDSCMDQVQVHCRYHVEMSAMRRAEADKAKRVHAAKPKRPVDA